MTLIVKLALLLVVFTFIIYVLKAIRRFSLNLRRIRSEIQQMRNPATNGGTVSADMVRCAVCGTFVAARDAVQLRIRDRSQSYCSEICLQKQQTRA